MSEEREEKDTIAFEDFQKLDLRIAVVREAEAHPNADKLLKLQVDLGDEQRQLCAGIRGIYEPQQLIGRRIVMVANLAPRKIRGETSHGMLLAATVKEAEQIQDVVLLQPDRVAPPGAPVS